MICPKCQHARPPNTTVPDWQCPACGVAYVKAVEGVQGNVSSTKRSFEAHSGVSEASGFSIPWGKIFLFALLACGAWATMQAKQGKLDNLFGVAAMSEKDIVALAETIKPGDVKLYTTTSCPYCAQARAWLNQYGFPYEECDAEARKECSDQLVALGGNGVPYLLVKGKHVDGFDSDKFLQTLK
jgi:glutaredoxin